MVSTNLQATHAGVLSKSGAPFGPFSKGSPPMVSPSRSWDLKKLNAIACWPLPRILSANSLGSLMMACAPESVFTPRTTRGGAKAAWVTQLTVAAATAPFLPSAVKTYRPYGIIRSAVFLASSFITHLSLSRQQILLLPFLKAGTAQAVPTRSLASALDTYGPSLALAIMPFIPQTETPRKLVESGGPSSR